MSWQSRTNDREDRSLRPATSPSVHGNEADQEDVASEDPLIVRAENRIQEEREELARFREMWERHNELLEELGELRRERMRAEQKVRALRSRVEREQNQPELISASGDGSRRGRPVRIEVDDEARAVVKSEALHRKLLLVSWVGDWIWAEVESLEAGEGSGRPSSRRRRSPGEEDPCPRQRFLRIDVDYETWAAFRAFALDFGVSAGRYVGELAEAVAYENGWRSGKPPRG